MRVERVLGIAVLVGVWSTAAAASGHAPHHIVVRVYNTVADNGLDAAFAAADSALATVSVHAEWVRCGAGHDVALRCRTTIPKNELAVRIVAGPPPTTVSDAVTLGESLVDQRTGTGTLATVFIDRVNRLASESRTDMPTLLGRAIAHELGHLLMATRRHSGTGLMREIWTPVEVARDYPRDWSFTPHDETTLTRRAERAGLFQDPDAEAVAMTRIDPAFLAPQP